MIRTIHLYGRLKKEFGAKFKFDVQTAGEALRALNVAFPGKFVKIVREGNYKIVRGDKKTGLHLDLEEVCKFRLGNADLHIIPVPAGAASQRTKGTIKTVVGVALVGAAIFASGGLAGGGLLAGMGTTAFGVAGMGVTYGTIATIGLGIALMGVSTLLSKPADASNSADTPDDSSHMLNGPMNTVEQGNAIPLIYGEVITGSQLGSFDADIEDIGSYQSYGDMGGYDPALTQSGKG